MAAQRCCQSEGSFHAWEQDVPGQASPLAIVARLFHQAEVRCFTAAFDDERFDDFKSVTIFDGLQWCAIAQKRDLVVYFGEVGRYLRQPPTSTTCPKSILPGCR